MTKPKVIAALAVVAVLIIVIPFVADFISSMPVREVQSSILSVCNSQGLSNVEVNLQFKNKYEDVAFYNVRITCIAFSSLSSEEMLDCFDSICCCEDYEAGVMFLDSYILINSDGHTYTYSASSYLDGTPDTIYCDGEAIYVGETPEKREFSYSGNFDYDRDSSARHTDSEAFTIAQKIVKENLKSPGTAKFCSILQASVSNSGNSYTVTGWVDSENSFGATLRTNFIVTYSAIKHGDEIGYKNASVIFE